MKKSIVKPTYPECPECDKLSKVNTESNSIGYFLDWLQEQKIVLFKWQEETDNNESKFIDKDGNPAYNIYSKFSWDEESQKDIHNPNYELIPEGYYRVTTSFDKLLAKYFNIDLTKVEHERRKILEFLRTQN